MDEGRTTLEMWLQWEQLLYPVLGAGLALIVWVVRNEFRIHILERDQKDAHRTFALEKRFNELHNDHQNLEKKVDEVDGKVNRIIGILSMVHPEAARSLDD